MSKMFFDKENKQSHKKSNGKETSDMNYFVNKNWEDNFCDEDYSDSPCIEEDICKDKNHKEKKNKEHESCCKKEKLIKCKVVIAKKHVQKIGILEISAPIGVGININNGKLTVPLELEPCGEPVFTPKIIKDMLINEGYTPVRLKVKNTYMECCSKIDKEFSKLFFIPFQSETKIKGIKPDDEVEETIKTKSFAVLGFPEINSQKCGVVTTNLILKVILDVEIVISRECIIPVITQKCKHD